MTRQRIYVVHIRLVGTPHDVTFWLGVLDELAVLTDVSDPAPARDGQIRVYATIRRRAPLTGGAK